LSEDAIPSLVGLPFELGVADGEKEEPGDGLFVGEGGSPHGIQCGLRALFTID